MPPKRRAAAAGGDGGEDGGEGGSATVARAKRVRGAAAVYKEESDSEPEEDEKVQREKSKKVVERKEEKKEKSKSGKKEVKSGAKKEETGTKGEKEKSGVKEEKSGRGKKGRADKSGKIKTEEEDEPRMKSVMVKGAAPVDSECPVAEAHHVYSEKSGVWDAMLNQTNIQNNNNKFYMIQLLESDSGRSFGVWMRWGRVGVRGQTNWQPVGGLEEAKRIFKVKFQDKTRNNWEEREVFEKVAGKYDLVSVDYCQDETDTAVAAAVKEEPVASVLAQEVQDLVSLVCSLQTMERAVMEMQYDTRKAPLGKLTKDQITAGYKALKLISDCVEAGRTSGKELVDACNDFYTRIPHAFGMRTPPLVTTREEVKTKLQLLEALGDIQVALKLLGSIQQSGNVVDQRYRQLQCSMEPVAEGAVRQLLVKSILSTHAQSHSLYSMEVQQVFSLEKSSETENFHDCGNRQLLFHGSRLSNWAGILGQGLRIAPPEAPATGYMFGKGVYFADMSSKAANYCFPTRTQPYGLLLVCEVARGEARQLVQADSGAAKLPKGCSSVVGLGRVEPSCREEVPGCQGLTLPMGPARDTRIAKETGYTLNYNEFIVYDTKQIKMKFLAKIKFNFKK